MKRLANAFIRELCEETEVDLTYLNIILYTTAKVLEKRLGVKPKKKKKPTSHEKPRWRLKIEREIENMRSEISILTEIENGKNPRTRKSRKLKRRFQLTNPKEISPLKEELKQKMQAKA